MAGVTRVLEFTTGILILPQRQTALVAKQAATLDVLSGGRLRLGVAVGWNKVEYVGLNRDFHTRGRRIEEQVYLLRRLWTQPLVSFNGRWHDIPDAGINPLPAQRAIPIWFGGYVDVVLRRVAEMGDGWMPGHRRAEDARPDLEKLDRYLEAAGRGREEIGLEARLNYGEGDPDAWNRTIEAWKAVGATHLSFNTMGKGFKRPADHLSALGRFAEAVGLTDLVPGQ
jgi:probable F420-dependent oxidoreductase